MTAIGFIFVAAYAVGLAAKGRVGLLTVAAAAIPFNDSAAIVVGSASLPPFYLGMLAYLPLALFRFGVSHKGASLPLIFTFWAVIVTVSGPALFQKMPVVASGLGIDAQVGRLSELDYSISNAAQVVYLVINVSLLLVLANSEDRKTWIPVVPAVVGTSVALLALGLTKWGIQWPDVFFRNNAPNAYAYVKSARLAAQFSEPSHLGSFALVAAVILRAYAITMKPRPGIRWVLLMLAAGDVVLIITTASAAALGGAAIAVLLVTAWGLYRFLFRNASVPVGVPLAVTAMSLILLLALPHIWAYAGNVIEYKQTRGMASIRARTSADLTSWRIFLDSYSAGVGLGSNRSSSLLLLLLSQVGLVGTALFILMMSRAVRDGLKSRTGRIWAVGLVAVLAPALVAYPDFVSPMMWLLAGFCWKIPAPDEPENHSSTGSQGDRRPGQMDTLRIA